MRAMRVGWFEFLQTPLWVVNTMLDIIGLEAQAEHKRIKESERKSRM